MSVLAMTFGGAYTHAQYQRMFANAEFKSCVVHTPPALEQLIVADR